jgi:predicted TIM-barrel fold metal-dependent hydrolase
MPLSVLSLGRLGIIGAIARRHPGCQLVVDHLGLLQSSKPPVPPEPFAGLADLLPLAVHPNVTVKLTGVLTLSRQPFPFADVWDDLARVFDGFGIERCMWGTDWTRAVMMVSYADAVAAFATTERLAPAERAELMGGTAARTFRWAPGPDAGADG